MASPAPVSPRPRRPSTPSFLVLSEDYPYHVPTRSGALASLIRTRSASSLSSIAGNRRVRDEEAGHLRHPDVRHHGDDEDLGRLLMDEERLNFLLHGTRARSKNLLGKSNPRYRWERYWKTEDELRDMSAPL